MQPKSDDPISTVICLTCWNQVNDFHQFYVAVESAHRLLTERFSLKSGQDQGKVEHGEDSEQQEEEQDEDQELGLPGSEGGSFTNEQFLTEVIAQQEQQTDSNPPKEQFIKEDNATVNDPETSATLPTEQRRETRSTAKSKAHHSLPPSTPPEKSNSVANKSKAKRTPCKAEGTPQKSKRYADYKQCMLDIDAKISAHMRLTCDVCHEGQETFLLLCKHMLQEHHRKGYAICCNKKFYKRSFLTDHIDRHADPEKFK